MLRLQKVFFPLRIVCSQKHPFPNKNVPKNNIKPFSTHTHSFNNKIVKRIENKKKDVETNLVTELKKITELDDTTLLQIYHRSISIHQATKQRSGSLLEESVLNILTSNYIPYQQQVVIDEKGFITNNRKDCYYIVDIVVGYSIQPGDHISQYIVLSCKTTCRERWKQDEWTLQFTPKKYLLLTLSNDYPPSKRFNENYRRKIITCSPKQRDKRLYKLDFDDLIEEIMS